MLNLDNNSDKTTVNNSVVTNHTTNKPTQPPKPTKAKSLIAKKADLLKIMLFVQVATHAFIIIFAIALFALHAILYIHGNIIVNESLVNVYIAVLAVLIIICVAALGVNIYNGFIIIQTDWQNDELNRQRESLGLATMFFVGAIATFMFYNAILKHKKTDIAKTPSTDTSTKF